MHLDSKNPTPLPFDKEAPDLETSGQTWESNEDFLWDVHKYTNEYIRFADAKAAFVAAASTALIGSLVASSLFDSLFERSAYHWRITQWVGMAGLVLLSLSLAFAVSVIKPRLWNEAPVGYIFWESVIRHGTADAYAKCIKSVTGSDRSTALSEHIFVLAAVAKRKYLYVNLAIISATLGGMLTGSVLFVQHAAR